MLPVVVSVSVTVIDIADAEIVPVPEILKPCALTVGVMVNPALADVKLFMTIGAEKWVTYTPALFRFCASSDITV